MQFPWWMNLWWKWEKQIRSTFPVDTSERKMSSEKDSFPFQKFIACHKTLCKQLLILMPLPSRHVAHILHQKQQQEKNNSPYRNLRQLSLAVDSTMIDLDLMFHPNLSHYFHSAGWIFAVSSVNLCKTGCCRFCDAMMMWWMKTTMIEYYVCNPFFIIFFSHFNYFWYAFLPHNFFVIFIISFNHMIKHFGIQNTHTHSHLCTRTLKRLPLR